MNKQLLFLFVVCLSFASLLPGSVLAQTPQPPSIQELKTRSWNSDVLPVFALPHSTQVASCELDRPNFPISITDPAGWSYIVFQASAYPYWQIHLAQGDWSQETLLTPQYGVNHLRPRLNRGVTRVVYYSDRDGNYEVYAIDTDGADMTRLTSNSAADTAPAWSPDGSRIAFVSDRDGNREIYIMNADGSAQTRVTADAANDFSPAWSPDGQQIAWVRAVNATDGVLWIMNVDGSNARSVTGPMRFLQNLSWSPDGTQLAFDYDADGDNWNELAMMNADGTGLQIRLDAPSYLLADYLMGSWSPDGEYLIYTFAEYYQHYTGLLVRDIDIGWISAVGSDWGWRGPSEYIMSPDWQTADTSAPQSQMVELPQYSRSNNLLVQWSGTDSGPAAIAGYDVQYRVGATGAWTDWLIGSTATFQVFAGTPGTTVYFRVRAYDEAGNTEVWPAGQNGDTFTTLYTWQLDGELTDNRGTPLGLAPITIAPAALNSVRTGLDGRCMALLTAEGTHTLQVSRAGYATPPALSLDVFSDDSFSLYLSPSDNLIENGSFEIGDLADWIVTGTLSSSATNLIHHSGQKAASMGLSSSYGAGQVSLSQATTLPVNSHKPTLAFTYQLWGSSPVGQSHMQVNVSNGISTTQVFTTATSTVAWPLVWIDLQPWVGQTITVSFSVVQAELEPSIRLFLDDVSLSDWLTPLVNDVSPERVEAGVTTPITIAGNNLLPGSLTVRLGHHSVPDVHWVSSTTLTATLPMTMPPGTYDVWVSNPGGQEGVWSGKLRVGKQVYLPLLLKE